jgi:hypothetical protein
MEETRMANLDRSEIVELLGRLGAEDQAAVVDAARELTRRVNDSGLTWNELLRAQWGEADDGPDVETAAAAPDESSADAPPIEESKLAPDAAETTRLIGRLLARKDISDNLRQELADIKRAIADGSLDAMDSRYIRALARRLGA